MVQEHRNSQLGGRHRGPLVALYSSHSTLLIDTIRKFNKVLNTLNSMAHMNTTLRNFPHNINATHKCEDLANQFSKRRTKD